MQLISVKAVYFIVLFSGKLSLIYRERLL